MDNAIPICRSVFKHWIYQDAEYFKVWFTMLSDARYHLEPKTVMYEKSLCVQHYGEFIFGYKKWSEKTGVSYQRLRGLIKKLIQADMIRLKTQTNHFSLYEIVNYAKFNSQTSQTEQGLEENDNMQVTASQQSGNSQVTTTKKVKKDKKDKNKDIIPNYTDNIELQKAINDFVLMRKSIKKQMTERALEMMLDKLNKISSTDNEKIEILNNSIMNSWQGIFPLNKKEQKKSSYEQQCDELNKAVNMINASRTSGYDDKKMLTKLPWQ